MNTDVLQILAVVVALVAVLALLFGALLVYEKKAGRKPGRGRSVSSADSFSDITNSVE